MKQDQNSMFSNFTREFVLSNNEVNHDLMLLTNGDSFNSTRNLRPRVDRIGTNESKQNKVKIDHNKNSKILESLKKKCESKQRKRSKLSEQAELYRKTISKSNEDLSLLKREIFHLYQEIKQNQKEILKTHSQTEKAKNHLLSQKSLMSIIEGFVEKNFLKSFSDRELFIILLLQNCLLVSKNFELILSKKMYSKEKQCKNETKKEFIKRIVCQIIKNALYKKKDGCVCELKTATVKNLSVLVKNLSILKKENDSLVSKKLSSSKGFKQKVYSFVDSLSKHLEYQLMLENEDLKYFVEDEIESEKEEVELKLKELESQIQKDKEKKVLKKAKLSEKSAISVEDRDLLYSSVTFSNHNNNVLANRCRIIEESNNELFKRVSIVEKEKLELNMENDRLKQEIVDLKCSILSNFKSTLLKK